MSGGMEEGGENDQKLRFLIGDDYRTLCGVGQPQQPGVSPGYNHALQWDTVVKVCQWDFTKQRRVQMLTHTQPHTHTHTHSYSAGAEVPFCSGAFVILQRVIFIFM